MKRSILLAMFLLASFLLRPLYAQTPTRFVNGTDGTCDGNSPCHGSIQDAVDAAAAGEVIEVQTSAEYQENVLVVSRSDLTIQNRPGDEPQISPLTGHGLVLFASPNFTLDGPRTLGHELRCPRHRQHDRERVDLQWRCR